MCVTEFVTGGEEKGKELRKVSWLWWLGGQWQNLRGQVQQKRKLCGEGAKSGRQWSSVDTYWTLSGEFQQGIEV